MRKLVSSFQHSRDGVVHETMERRAGHSQYHGILRKFAYLLSAHWVREALRTIFIISIARHSAATYGEFMLALSIGQVVLFVAEFGFNQHLVALLVRSKQAPGDVLAQVSLLKALLLVCGCIGMVLFVIWQEYSTRLQALVFILGMGVALEAITSTFFVACQVEGHQDIEGKIRTFSATLGFGYGLSFLFMGAAPLVVACYKLVETLAGLAGALLTIGKRVAFRLRGVRFTDAWTVGRGSIVFTLMAIATILYNKANIFYLQKFSGAVDVAQYCVTWEMVDGISALTSNLLLKNVLFPLFMNLWETDRAELAVLLRNSTQWLIAAAIPIMFVLFIESDRLIGLIYGAAYGDAVWMQKYLVVTIIIGFLHNLAAYLMISMKREFLLLGFYIGGLLFNLACCSLLIPASPLMGTVLAIILTKGVVAVATVVTCQVSLGLFSRKALSQILMAVITGGVLYFLATSVLLREAAEVLALLPILTLVFHWWREFRLGRARHAAPEGRT